MENQEISGLIKAKARILAHIIETVLGRIPTYEDLQKFTRAVIEDDPSKEIILYENQTIGFIEIAPVKHQYFDQIPEVKFIPSVSMSDDLYEYCL